MLTHMNIWYDMSVLIKLKFEFFVDLNDFLNWILSTLQVPKMKVGTWRNLCTSLLSLSCYSAAWQWQFPLVFYKAVKNLWPAMMKQRSFKKNGSRIPAHRNPAEAEAWRLYPVNIHPVETKESASITTVKIVRHCSLLIYFWGVLCHS